MIDTRNRTFWFPYRVDGNPTCMCPTGSVKPTFRDDVNSDENGDAESGLWTFAIAYPSLPEGVETVDLTIPGDGKIIKNIPVGDGPLTSMANPSDKVKEQSFTYFQKLSSSGWPYVPETEYFERAIQPEMPHLGTRDTEVPLSGEIYEFSSSENSGVDKRAEGADAEYTPSADVAFDFDSSDLSGAARAALEQVVAETNGEAKSVSVYGYTDDQDDEQYNLALSSSRAVAAALKENLDESIFDVQGFGEKGPVASNGNEAGRAQNRRVVVIIKK